MGFLEKERQKREAKGREELARKERLRLEKQTVEQRARQQLEESRKLFDQAERYFEQSGTEGLVKKLCDIVGGSGSSSSSYFHGKISDEVNPTGSDSFLYRLEWDKYSNGYRNIYKKIIIETTPAGTVRFCGGLLGSRSISREQWQRDRGVLEKALERVYHRPMIGSESFPSPPPWESSAGPCLPSDILISTPIGITPIKNLKVGDCIWTVDKFGYRVQAPILQKTKRIASKNHKVAHIILKDGRELIVSPGHPTINYREIGSLVKGDDLDMSYVDSIKIIPYRGKFTYDILPYGDTGGYWANNILIGSTLSDQFQNFLYKPLYLSA